MSYCPTCRARGDAPCRTPSGKVKSQPHNARLGRHRTINASRIFSQEVKRACDSVCMCAGLSICRNVRHKGDHAHHILSRGRGGGNDPSNGIWVCWQAHDWIHAHPAEAEMLGLLAPSQ